MLKLTAPSLAPRPVERFVRPEFVNKSSQQVFSQALTLPQAWVVLSVEEENDLQIQNAE
ncbi:MAG: hypothetical protein ACHBNF_12930 [Chromatiales bacterium]